MSSELETLKIKYDELEKDRNNIYELWESNRTRLIENVQLRADLDLAKAQIEKLLTLDDIIGEKIVMSKEIHGIFIQGYETLARLQERK